MIINNLKKNYKYNRLILYGRGIKTLEAINRLKNSKIKIDGISCEDKDLITLYGYKIIEINKLVKNDLIIVCSSIEKVNTIQDEIKTHINTSVLISNYYEIFDNLKVKLPNPIYPSKSKIIKYINQYEYITFDIFDTLIDRKIINPYDIYNWLDESHKQENNKYSIKTLRYEIGNKLGMVDSVSKRGIKLINIYEVLCKKINKYGTIEQCIKKEITFEKRFSVANQKGIDILNYAISLKKNITLISDTYFNEKEIRMLLNKINISSKLKCFLSSSTGYEKCDGSIFKAFLKKYKLNPSDCLHFGDNFVNDVHVPQKIKYKSVYLPSTARLYDNSFLKLIKNYHLSKYDQLATGLIKNKIINNFKVRKPISKIIIDDPFNYGYVFYSPLIVGYLNYLLKNVLQSSGRTKVLFCAREGYFFKKLFKYYLDVSGLDVNQFDTVYLKTSRRVSLPCLINNEQDLLDTIKINRYEGRLSYFLESRFNIRIKSGDDDVILDSLNNINDFIAAIKPYITSILVRCKKERKYYNNYLDTIISKKDDTLIVSDLGCRGASQAKLSSILPKSLHINGVYIAINKSNPYKHLHFNGYLDAGSSYFSNYSILIESIFTAPHGVYCYAKPSLRFHTGKKRYNQYDFKFREKVVDGIKAYIYDFVKIAGDPLSWSGSLSPNYVDNVMNLVTNKNVTFSKTTKNSLYYDNELARENEYVISI